MSAKPSSELGSKAKSLPRNVGFTQWVVKVSKHCNLRCTYCYEFPFLADRTRMQSEQLKRMFTHIADYYGGTSRRMDFVWHGGEPLLLKPAFYHCIEDLQHQILDGVDVPFINSVQTNLTFLTEGALKLLKTFFKSVGVSIDLFGDQRVNIAGKTVERKVLENMQILKNEGIRFGCITVLSKLTAPHIESIYHFFEDIDVSFRLLPIYRTGYPGQQDHLALNDTEIIDAFKKAVDLWFASDSYIQVRPIEDYIRNVVGHLDGGSGWRHYYNKLDAEVVYIVDTDGSLYSNADAYDPTLRHGNIFKESLYSMKESENYLRAVKAAHDRMRATCSSCRFYGKCSGFFMGEATPEQRWYDEKGRLKCGVAQPVQDYIERILIKAGLVDRKSELLLKTRIEEKLNSALTAPFPG